MSRVGNWGMRKALPVALRVSRHLAGRKHPEGPGVQEGRVVQGGLEGLEGLEP